MFEEDGTEIGMIPGAEVFRFEKLSKVKYGNRYWEELLLYTREKNIDTILTSCRYLHLSTRLLWEMDTVKQHYILDSSDRFHPEEYKAAIVSRMWNHIAAADEDEDFNAIRQAGWKSARTGEYFTKEEMMEFSDNVFEKLKGWLLDSATVLEVGCASGFSMFRLAPFVGQYYAADVSARTIEMTAREATRRGLDNVEFWISDALEIGNLGRKDVDICILNSVAQYFPGYNYFFSVIRALLGCMNRKGVIFAGDLIDFDKVEEEKNELRELGREDAINRKDLQYSRCFLEQLPCYFPEIERVEISDKLGRIDNELRKYRFDAILFVNQDAVAERGTGAKHYGTADEIDAIINGADV